MNTRVKQVWIEALRGGEYEQCNGALALNGDDFDSFCCLGVLTNIYCEETAQGFDDVATNREGLPLGTLPPAVVNWAGLGSDNPIVGDDTLVECNDNRHKTFPEIADLIEKHL